MGRREKVKLVAPKREKVKLGAPKGKREKVGDLLCDPIPLGIQTARTHARPHARAARHETISWLDSPPKLRLPRTPYLNWCCDACIAPMTVPKKKPKGNQQAILQ